MCAYICDAVTNFLHNFVFSLHSYLCNTYIMVILNKFLKFSFCLVYFYKGIGLNSLKQMKNLGITITTSEGVFCYKTFIFLKSKLHIYLMILN